MTPPSTVSADKILATKKGAVATAFPGNAQSSGSFTVVNIDLWNEGSGIPLPAANTLFPELARSVYELEKEIIEKQVPIPMAKGMSRDGSSFFRRPPSTHCAVNRVRLKWIFFGHFGPLLTHIVLYLSATVRTLNSRRT
jgi:hypothetical protein